MKGMCKIQEFIYIRKKLKEIASQLNEVVATVLKKYNVKAEIKQKLLNTANLSVVLKTEDNKNIGILCTLSYYRNKISVKFNNNASVSLEVAGLGLSDWVCGASVCAELRYWADYTLRNTFSIENLQKRV